MKTHFIHVLIDFKNNAGQEKITPVKTFFL